MISSLKDILVVTDIDNTLLTIDGGIPACNVAAIELFTKLGGRFTFATGLTADSAAQLLRNIPINAPAITGGGTVLYDFAKHCAVQTKVLLQPSALAAIEDVMRLFPQVGVAIMADNGRVYVVRATLDTHQHALNEHISHYFSDLDQVPNGWNKVLFMANAPQITELERYMRLRRYDGIYFIATNDIYFEIMPKSVTKGTALVDLCNHLHIPIENTIAFGDFGNDIPLLRAAGTAVAVGNATKEVKKIAHAVTANCDDGGVGQYLYQLTKQYMAY